VTPLEVVLDKLSKVRRSGNGYMALCPSHEDRHPSLAIGEGAENRVLFFCFAGCDEETILKDLQLEWSDLFAVDKEWTPNRKPPPQRIPYRLPRETARALLSHPAIVLEVELAKDLARLSQSGTKAAILSAWDALVARVDVPFVLELAILIRGVALLQFGNADELTPRWSDILEDYVESDGIDRAVSRLLRRVA
jgi:hypothetical protein